MIRKSVWRGMMLTYCVQVSARFTKQGKLVWEHKTKKVTTGVESSVCDWLFIKGAVMK